MWSEISISFCLDHIALAWFTSDCAASSRIISLGMIELEKIGNSKLTWGAPIALSGLLVSPFGEICMTYQLQLTYRIVFYNPRLDMHHDHSLKFILSRIFSRRPLRLIAFVLRAHVPQMSASRPVIILIQNRLRALDGYLIMDKKSLSSSLRLRGKN